MRLRVGVLYIIVYIIAYYIAGNAYAQEEPSKETEVGMAGSSEQNAWKYGSLMFDKNQTEWIEAAIQSYEKKVPLEILLPSLFPPNTPVNNDEILEEKPATITNIIKETVNNAPVVTEAPAFYLKTILYFSDDNWAVWVNDKKITDFVSNPIGKANIVGVTANMAVFTWENSHIDLIDPNWKTGYMDLGDGKYASPAKNIIVDTVNGNISFSLHPNQSLTSSPLQIIEGRATTKAIGALSAFGQNSTNDAKETNTNQNEVLEKTPVTGDDKNVVSNSMEALKSLRMLQDVLDKVHKNKGKGY